MAHSRYTTSCVQSQTYVEILPYSLVPGPVLQGVSRDTAAWCRVCHTVCATVFSRPSTRVRERQCHTYSMSRFRPATCWRHSASPLAAAAAVCWQTCTSRRASPSTLPLQCTTTAVRLTGGVGRALQFLLRDRQHAARGSPALLSEAEVDAELERLLPNLPAIAGIM